MDRVHGRCRRAARPCSRLQRETPTRRDRTFSTAREDGAPTCQEARTSRSPNPRIFCLSWSGFSWSLGGAGLLAFLHETSIVIQEPGYCESSTKLKLSSFYASLDYCHYRRSCSVITFKIVVFAVSGGSSGLLAAEHSSIWLGWLRHRHLTPSHGHHCAKAI